MTPYYRNEVRKLDPKLGLDEPAAYCAAMLLCAAKNGANDKDVIERTGVPLREGKAIAWRLRRNRVWRKNATHHSGWDDPESGGIAFWLDVNVGTGMMRRSWGPRSSVARHIRRAEVKFYDVGNRDIMGQDERGGYYYRHVNALTAEGLHSKSDIAAELAHRDIQIDQLTAERDMLVQIKIDLVAKVEALEKRLAAGDGGAERA